MRPRGRREARGERAAEKERGTARGQRWTEGEDGREPHSRPHTPERLQHAERQGVELPLCERRKSARGMGWGTRNGVYSSCFFLSFVDSALLCSRGESAARCSTIRLHSQGRPGEREIEKTLFHDRAKSARARHAYPPLIRITLQRALSRKYPVAVGSPEVAGRIERHGRIFARLSPDFRENLRLIYGVKRRGDTCCAIIALGTEIHGLFQ